MKPNHSYFYDLHQNHGVQVFINDGIILKNNIIVYRRTWPLWNLGNMHGIDDTKIVFSYFRIYDEKWWPSRIHWRHCYEFEWKKFTIGKMISSKKLKNWDEINNSHMSNKIWMSTVFFIFFIFSEITRPFFRIIDTIFSLFYIITLCEY